MPDPAARPALSRRALLRTTLAAGGLAWEDPLPRAVTPTPSGQRRVGLDYSLWHKDRDWKGVWGRPQRGFYRSDDPALIRAHAAELVGAGVDFLVLDATNDIGSDIRSGVGIPYQQYEGRVIAAIFDVFAGLQHRPRLCFMLGYVPKSADLTNGRVAAKADEIHEVYVRNPRYAPLFETYRGRPLLIVFGETPARWQDRLPPFADPRFTVRFMTAGLTEQPALLRDRVSRLGYWSWQDRGPPSYPVVDGHPEAMMVTAFWPDDRANQRPGQGRRDGATYRQEWARARRIGPRFVIAGTFNEYILGEQPSVEMSKDVEPTVELGSTYLDILREQAALFHAGR